MLLLTGGDAWQSDTELTSVSVPLRFFLTFFYFFFLPKRALRRVWESGGRGSESSAAAYVTPATHLVEHIGAHVCACTHACAIRSVSLDGP